MERELAKIKRIDKIVPIFGSDRIELAIMVDSTWQVVVKKDEFKEGDLVIYCEIDSLLPDKPEFDFLRDKKFRIKTLKIRGVLSQGIIFPLSILPSDCQIILNKDVTEILNITKYESPEELETELNPAGLFPVFIPKTNQERIQNNPIFLYHYKNTPLVITEKLDGTSATYYLDDNNKLTACSRNLKIRSGNNKYYHIAEKYKIEDVLKSSEYKIAIQGEIIGHKINGNNYKLNHLEFYVFSVYNLESDSYEDWDKVELLGLPTVPVLEPELVIAEKYTNSKDIISDMMLYADRKSVLNTNSNAEGIVIRTKRTMPGKFSIKVVSNKYLLNKNY